MPNKMLIDATHPEETRVVVLRGNRVEEFDFESAHRKQLRGNIYLAKVTRVEPSLQAAFVDYGGNRHGFLAFSEIHPDYYQIPVADRQALIDEEERAQRAADDEIDRRSRRHRHHGNHPAARRDAVRRGEHAELAADDSAGPDQEAASPADHGESAEHSELGTLAAQDSTEAASAEGTSSEAATDIVEIPGDAALGSDAEPDEAHPEAAEVGGCANTPKPSIRALNRARRISLRTTTRPKLPRPLLRSKPASMTTTARTRRPPKRSSSWSAAPTRWRKSPIARRAIAANTRSKK